MCSLQNRVEDYLLCDDTSMHHVYSTVITLYGQYCCLVCYFIMLSA